MNGEAKAFCLEGLRELPKDRGRRVVEKGGPPLVGDVERGSAFGSLSPCVLERGEDTLANVASIESVYGRNRSHSDSVARTGLDGGERQESSPEARVGVDGYHSHRMSASSTVENYLKAILQAQVRLRAERTLVPMGQLAATLGVVPGTATTMVKTLAESGLVEYEPYVGVRLTAAGERLAAMVLRRHRLLELFLVQVMGMSWAEVHDEAEHLEHAVSDRLIERIDEMLGRPSVDPHGDPIPSPDGVVQHTDHQSLLNCPLNACLTIARITDQDAKFLHFVEESSLKPGSDVVVDSRDEAADAVSVVGPGGRRITLGTRAASKLLVHELRRV